MLLLDRQQVVDHALLERPEFRAVIVGIQSRCTVACCGDAVLAKLAPALEQLSAEARRSRRRRDEADARRLPVRLSFPLVVCTLPSFVLLAIAPAVLAALSSLGATAW